MLYCDFSRCRGINTEQLMKLKINHNSTCAKLRKKSWFIYRLISLVQNELCCLSKPIHNLSQKSCFLQNYSHSVIKYCHLLLAGGIIISSVFLKKVHLRSNKISFLLVWYAIIQIGFFWGVIYMVSVSEMSKIF